MGRKTFFASGGAILALLVGCQSASQKLWNLEASRNPSAVRTVERYLHSRDYDTKATAVRVLGTMEAMTEARRLLVEAAESPDPELRAEAARTMLLCSDSELNRKAFSLTGDESASVRSLLADTLFLAATSSTNGYFRRKDGSRKCAFGDMTWEVREDPDRVSDCENHLIALTTDTDPTVRESAGRSLAKLGTDRSVAAALSLFREDPNPHVRAGIARAFGATLNQYSFHQTFEAVELSVVLSEPSFEIRLMGCHMSPYPVTASDAVCKRIVNALMDSLQEDPQTFIVEYTDKLPLLPIYWRGHTTFSVRTQIVDSLSAYRDPELPQLRAALTEMTQSPSSDVCDAAREILHRLDRTNRWESICGSETRGR